MIKLFSAQHTCVLIAEMTMVTVVANAVEKLHSVIPDVGPLGWLDSPGSDLILKIIELRMLIDPLADVQGLISRRRTDLLSEGSSERSGLAH